MGHRARQACARGPRPHPLGRRAAPRRHHQAEGGDRLGHLRRLNSYAKQHELYRALKAFGQIIKTLFVLRYVDEIELRQAIERQLSRVELAHRFTRDVAVGNPREFEQIDKESQEAAESCNRLIKNAILCWNYLYFEHRLRGCEFFDEKPDWMQLNH